MIRWDFSGKTALVTGGSRGIGQEIVKRLAEAGAEVVFTYARDQEAAEQLIDECKNAPGTIRSVRANFTVQADLEALVDTMRQVGRLDCLVHNAGILCDAPLYKMSDEQWATSMQVNLHSVFTVTQKLFRMLAVAQGSIVNISSVAGIVGGVGQVNYSAAKAGVIGFTKAFSREAGSLGIRVNAVAPGYVETEMLQSVPEPKRQELFSRMSLKRLGSPEDIANSVLFLLSEQAAYITGQVLVVDGGLI